jgi:hypothetical protein
LGAYTTPVSGCSRGTGRWVNTMRTYLDDAMFQAQMSQLEGREQHAILEGDMCLRGCDGNGHCEEIWRN